MSKQLKTAERKGRNAARAGRTEEDCPYKDRRTERGAITWSRAFRRAWFKGFRNEKKRMGDG